MAARHDPSHEPLSIGFMQRVLFVILMIGMAFLALKLLGLWLLIFGAVVIAVILRGLAEPLMRPNENLVDVNYQIFIEDKLSGRMDQLSETHTMRYLFVPEIQLLFESAGLSLLNCTEFMSTKEPSLESWNVMFLGTRG